MMSTASSGRCGRSRTEAGLAPEHFGVAARHRIDLALKRVGDHGVHEATAQAFELGGGANQRDVARPEQGMNVGHVDLVGGAAWLAGERSVPALSMCGSRLDGLGGPGM